MSGDWQGATNGGGAGRLEREIGYALQGRRKAMQSSAGVLSYSALPINGKRALI
jgi:hypothetical protein